MPPAVVMPFGEPLIAARSQSGSLGDPNTTAASGRAGIRGSPEGDATASGVECCVSVLLSDKPNASFLRRAADLFTTVVDKIGYTQPFSYHNRLLLERVTVLPIFALPD